MVTHLHSWYSWIYPLKTTPGQILTWSSSQLCLRPGIDRSHHLLFWYVLWRVLIVALSFPSLYYWSMGQLHMFFCSQHKWVGSHSDLLMKVFHWNGEILLLKFNTNVIIEIRSNFHTVGIESFTMYGYLLLKIVFYFHGGLNYLFPKIT